MLTFCVWHFSFYSSTKKKRHTWQQQLLEKIIFFNTLYLVKVQLNFFILSIRVWSGKLIFHWLTLPKEKSPSMRDKNQKLRTSDPRGRCGDLRSCELRTKKKNTEKKKKYWTQFEPFIWEDKGSDQETLTVWSDLLICWEKKWLGKFLAR